jgi:hypothetical protein
MRKTRIIFTAAFCILATIGWQIGYAASVCDYHALARLAGRWTRPGAVNWPGRDLLYLCRWKLGCASVAFQVRSLLWAAVKLRMPGAEVE